MKRILLAAVAAIAVAGTANAADIAAPPPAVKAPAYVPPPIFSWAGFYIGANVGWGWSDGSGTISPPAGTALTGDGDGVFGGFQAGYNWQFGNFVYGIETDFQLSAGEGTLRGAGIGRIGTLENEWFGTIRGRLGYAMNRWLFYVTGGGAYVHNTLTGCAGCFYGGFSTFQTGWTWTVGGGVEAALWQNWSAKLEYLYFATPSDVPTPPGTTVSGDTDTHTIRVGVNYHF